MITTEIRFFFKEIEDSLLEDLKQKFNLEPKEERTDRYWCFTESTKCGVKLREGKFQVKSLISLVDKAWKLQNWEKLSFDFKAPNPEIEAIAVKKKKWTSSFNQDLKPVDTEDEHYCEMELSEVDVNESKFLSICLEAKGNDQEERVRLVQNLLEKIKVKIPGLFSLLRQSEPASYPEFLFHRQNLL